MGEQGERERVMFHWRYLKKVNERKEERIINVTYFTATITTITLTPISSPSSGLLEEEQIEDPVETRAWMVLRRRVEEEVRQNTHNSIVFPPLLLDQVAEHVLELSKDEPCGLR